MKFTLYTANCTGNEKNILYPNQKVITSEADLKKAVVYDHVCAQYENFARSDANFLLSDVVPMDCDNDHSDDPKDWITQEKLASFLSDVAFAVTYSRHHMLAKGSKSARPRFHVFFPTAPCKDANSHKAIKQKIHKELPFFDGNALDASRFLFGCSSDLRKVTEHAPISKGVEASVIEEKYYEPPLINVIKFACNSCPEKRVMITEGVLGITATGKDLKEARKNAYEATEWITFANKYMRHDIGKAIDEA